MCEALVKANDCVSVEQGSVLCVGYVRKILMEEINVSISPNDISSIIETMLFRGIHTFDAYLCDDNRNVDKTKITTWYA